MGRIPVFTGMTEGGEQIIFNRLKYSRNGVYFDYKNMVNKNFLKFSLGFLAVIAFSFAVLIVIGYYKVDDSAINAASSGKELETAPR